MKLSKEGLQVAKELYENGSSLEKLGKIFSMKPYSISHRLRRENVTIRQQKIHSINENYFYNINTENKAYWLGFLMADGNVMSCRKKDGKLKSRVRIALSSCDKEHLGKALIDFEATQPLIEKVYKGHDTSIIEIYNKNFTNNLISQGCMPRKSKILKYPNIDINLHNHFIRGYFDGDGSLFVTAKNRWGIGIASTKELLYTIKNLIDPIGIKSYIRKHTGCYLLNIHRKNDILKFLNYIYKNSTISLDRKRKKYEKFLSII